MRRTLCAFTLFVTVSGSVASQAAPGSAIKSMIEAGSQRLEAGDAEGAIERFDKAARLDSKDPRPRYLSAVAWETKGDSARAEKLFKEALALDPKLADVRGELGALYLDEHKYDDAVRELKAALVLDSKMGDAWSNYGAALMHGHHCAEASDAFGKAAALNTASADPLLQQTLALRECKKIDDAVRVARQAAKVAGQSPNVLVNLALALEEAGKVDDARGALVSATQLKPDYATGWWTLGLLELHARKPGAAKTALERAQKIDATPARIADLGRAYRDLGDLAQAENLFKDALAKDAKFGPAHFYLAQLYAAEGKCADVKRELESSGVPEARASSVRSGCKAKK